MFSTFHLLSLRGKETNGRQCGRRFVIRGSLKKEDKGRRDPVNKVSRRKSRNRRKPKPKRPDEINPFKETYTSDFADVTSYQSIVRAYCRCHIVSPCAAQHGFLETQEGEEDDTEDIGDLGPEAESNLKEMMEKLEVLDRRYAHLVDDDEDESVVSDKATSHDSEADISQLFQAPISHLPHTKMACFLTEFRRSAGFR